MFGSDGVPSPAAADAPPAGKIARAAARAMTMSREILRDKLIT
jgi:hypothetical protein